MACPNCGGDCDKKFQILRELTNNLDPTALEFLLSLFPQIVVVGVVPSNGLNPFHNKN